MEQNNSQADSRPGGKKFLAFCGTRNIITLLTNARQWTYPDPTGHSAHRHTLFKLQRKERVNYVTDQPCNRHTN
jgi:hypothetical protein